MIYACIFLTLIPTEAINPDNHPSESKLFSVDSISLLLFLTLQIPREEQETKDEE